MRADYVVVQADGWGHVEMVSQIAREYPGLFHLEAMTKHARYRIFKVDPILQEKFLRENSEWPPKKRVLP
jgi:hypothetical protein